MIYNLPTTITVDGKEYNIRNKGDFRVVLDVISCLNDDKLTNNEKAEIALSLFLDGEIDEDMNFHGDMPEDIQAALNEMFTFINCGEEPEKENDNKPILMDWEKDFNIITPEINKVLGYETREKDKYTHWFTFIGGYMGIGDGTFQTYVSIRKKLAKGIKLEQWEQEFYYENQSKIELDTLYGGE